MIEKMVIDYIDKKDLNYIYDKELCDRLGLLLRIDKIKYLILSAILGFFIDNPIVNIIFLITVLIAYRTKKKKDADFSMVTSNHSFEKWYLVFFLSYGIGVWSNYLGVSMSITEAIKVLGVSLFINIIHRVLKSRYIRNFLNLAAALLIMFLYMSNPAYLLLAISSWYVFDKFNSLLLFLVNIILTIIFMSIGSTTTLLFFGTLGIYLAIKNLRKLNYPVKFN